jgi:hypothetical protein
MAQPAEPVRAAVEANCVKFTRANRIFANRYRGADDAWASRQPEPPTTHDPLGGGAKITRSVTSRSVRGSGWGRGL